MKRFLVTAGVVILLTWLMALAAPSSVALAQSGTPTPTPTPRPTLAGPRYELDLSSGSTVVIDRTVSYGEIAVSLLLAAEVVLFALYAIFRSIRQWLR